MKKPMKKIEKDDMKQLIQAIKQFSKETKDAEIIAASSKITSKDVLFYYLAQNAILENRVTKIETTQKLSIWFTGIAISIISLCVAVIRT
jgi:ABC-type transport system involved in Fe-S cluster assembly fused permease/ATPase subunit